MLKLDIIIKDNYFLRLYKILQGFITFNFETPIKDIIQYDNARLKTCEILFLLSIFFDYENIEGYEKYILYMMIPICLWILFKEYLLYDIILF
jgi:hypothetical protein